MMKNKTIMGLDISSATLGYAIIKNGTVSDYSYLKPNKLFNEFQQLQLVINQLNEVAQYHDVDIVAIEQISEFFGNKSTSKTIVKLAKWNAIISYAMFLDYQIEHYNVISIRTLIKNEYNIKNKTDIKKLEKEQMPHFLADLLDFEFEFEFNSKGKLKMENYDKADALAVAYYHILNNGEIIK